MSVKKIRKRLTELQTLLDPEEEALPASVFFNKKAVSLMWGSTLESIKGTVKNGKIENPWSEFQRIEKSIPKMMSSKEALCCIEILGKMLSCSTMLTDQRWSNFIPILNHCILEGAKNRSTSIRASSNEEWIEALTNSSSPMTIEKFVKDNMSHMANLFTSIKLAGMLGGVLRFERQVGNELPN